MPKPFSIGKIASRTQLSGALSLALLAAAIASVALFSGGGGNESTIPAESLSLLAETSSGVESVSFQAIANPVLNAALDSYGRSAELYDVSRWHEAFSAYFDGASRNLLDDVIFFDLDEPGRKRLGIGEGIDNAEARAIREAAIGPALAAEGRLAWFSRRTAAGNERSSPLLIAARLVKRLNDGTPIGVLVLVPEARRLASALEGALGPGPGAGAAESGGPFAFVVDGKGLVLASTEAGDAGLILEPDFPGGGRILTQEALGMGKGTAELRLGGRRRSVSFAKVPGGDWTVVVSARTEAGLGVSAFRWASLLALAVLMALALRRTLAQGTAASAAAVLAVAEGTARPYQPPFSLPAGSEPLAAGDSSETAPAWFRELAPRERSIVLLLAAGKSNKEIAARLGIAEQTVKNRLGLVYERLGVRDRVSAALIVSRARLSGLSSLPPDGEGPAAGEEEAGEAARPGGGDAS